MLKNDTYKDLLKQYHACAAARTGSAPKYGIMWNDQQNVYMAIIDELDERLLYEDKSSASHGQQVQIRVKVNALMKKVLAPKAVVVGTVEELEAQEASNRGYKAERLVYKFLGRAGEWAHDNKPFYMGGDVVINGEEVQLKYHGAQLTVEKCVARAARKLGLA